ncbi:MAG TPA: type II restriction endonuclease [Anaerolineaceae bacterium]|nr:type II restriction endonuclease [Anaerolineaceae bacterium]HQH86411.1 type II restriction endonuclease [Anaerolineaceae bacterium]
MKMIARYRTIGVSSNESALKYLIGTLKETICTYDFFVAWTKVLENVSKIEVSLNILNSLIGKDDIKSRLKELIKSYPEIVPVIPLLIAVRNNRIRIVEFGGKIIEYSFAKHKTYSEEEIEKLVVFFEKCGLLKILSDKSVKNLVDYSIGVEVGLDTNARKNRSGTAMENLIEIYVKAICDKYNYRYLSQATAAVVKAEFGKDIPTDQSDRRFDFAIDTSDKIYLLEVNYYSGQGSKLKAVAGEFRGLSELIRNRKNIGFIWITDGEGWNTTKDPLLEAISSIDYVFNIKMVEDGFLEEVITKGL